MEGGRRRPPFPAPSTLAQAPIPRQSWIAPSSTTPRRRWPKPHHHRSARRAALIYASLIVNITFALTIQSSLAPFFLSLAKHAEPSASKDELEKATAYHVSVATFTAGGLAVAVADVRVRG